MAPTEAEDRFVVFDAATASLVQVGSPGGPDSIYGNGHNLSPRVGAIFWPSADGRTVVRAAYAILIDQPVTNVVTPTAANPPLATPLTFTGNIRLDSAATTARPPGLRPSRSTRTSKAVAFRPGT